MTKFQLKVEYDYDFDVVGISCHMKDYRLCWALNQALGIGLTKQEKDLEIKSKKQADVSGHSVYSYYDETDHLEYHLLINKSGSSFILPEQKNADFILMLRNNFAVDVNELIGKIKEIEMIQTAFVIQLQELKSKENLIF